MMSNIGTNQRLSDRLAAVQHRHFVGRTAELELFRAALVMSESPFAVLYLYGPGGIGKTTLLHEYRRLAHQANVVTLYLDGRSVDPSPLGFLSTLSLTLEVVDDPIGALSHSERVVLLIDTYENLTPLDGWLREVLLPHLPSTSLTVIAGRNPPDPAWRTTPGWRDLTRIVSLRNLHPNESRNYLQIRGIPQSQQSAALEFTHGHPLALSLVADVVTQSDTPFDPKNAPDVVRLLLEHFVQHVPSPQHRQALEVCAHVRVTTEALLASIFGMEDAHRLFAWLYGLSFIEHSVEGIFPHDLVREVLDADLRWRHPERFGDVHRQVRRYLVRCIQQGTGLEQQQAMYSLMFLHRHDALWQPYHEKAAFGHVFAETASASDFPLILEMVQQHEGEASAQIAHYWLQRQPGQFVIFRSISGEVAGFMALLMLHQATPTDAEIDPAVKAALDFIEQYSPTRAGEEIVHFRFAMGRNEYQTVNVFNSISQCTGSYVYTHSNMAWTFFCMADPDFWQPVFSYLNHQRSPEADFKVGGRHYGVFSHDWRAEPFEVFDAIMTEREIATNLKLEMLEVTAPPLLVLSQTEFEQAVRQALRDYPYPDLLASNPLMRSRLMIPKAGDHVSTGLLQALIREAVEVLRGHPKQEKFYRALYHTYLQPAPTQEQAAELLGLPFGTYRTHLSSGVERITKWLWQRELYGFDDSQA